MEIHFNGPVKNVYTGNTEVYQDNAKKVINNNGVEQTNPATQHAQQAEEVEEIVEDKPTPSFFRTNAQSITKIQAKWQEALGNTTKTAVIRFVKSHDHSTGYFKLAGYTNEQLAEEFNKAQTKYKFTENDFENANKPLKK
jgi:hypothetical protein